jgi:hypothetical protein
MERLHLELLQRYLTLFQNEKPERNRRLWPEMLTPLLTRGVLTLFVSPFLYLIL